MGLQAVLERISAVPRTLKGRAELRCVDLTLLAASVPALGIPSEEDESMCSTIAEELKKPLAEVELVCQEGGKCAPGTTKYRWFQPGLPKRYMPPNARIPTQKCRMLLTELIDYESRTVR